MNDKAARLHTAAEIESELEVVDFVAGRMDAETRASFEERMDADPALRARVDEERRFSGDFVAAVPGESPPAAAFERIRPTVEARRGMPRWLPAAAAAGIVGVALLFAIPEDIGPEFQTLSSDPGQTLSTENRDRIVFGEHTTEAERAALADRLGFEIVSGPGAAGSFEVETAETVGRDRLAEWRSEDGIELAEPIVYSGVNGNDP